MNAEPAPAAPISPAREPGHRLHRGRRGGLSPAAPASATPGWRLQTQLRRQLLLLMAGVWLVAALGAGLGVWARTDEVLDSALKETAERLLMLPEAALA